MQLFVLCKSRRCKMNANIPPCFEPSFSFYETSNNYMGKMGEGE